ncbi:MAG: caspase family protein [Rhodomicrobium sp.]
MRYSAMLFCVFIWATARADDRPIPQLDTGGHTATIRGVAFTPDGKQLVSAGYDKVIRVWDLASGKTVRTIRGESALGNLGKIFAIALSPDGGWLAAGGDLGTSAGTGSGEDEKVQNIRLYDFKSGKLVALLKGHTGIVRALAFSADGRKLISGSSDNTAIIWDIGVRSGFRVPEPRLLHRLEGHKADIYAVAFSPNGRRAVTGSFDKELRLWKVSDGSQIALMAGHGDKVMSLAVAPDGTIASGDISGAILLWDGRFGRFLRTLAQQKIGAGSVTFSPDSKLLVSTCGFGDCSGALGYVYDAASGQRATSYSGHDNAVFATAFSPDGRWVATGGGANNEIHIWNPRTGQRRLGPNGQPLRLGGQGQAVWSAGFSADGRQIGWGNQDACPDKPHCPNGQIILQEALTLPLGAAPLGAPAALTQRDASTFLHASTSFGGWSLRHREGGNYGYDNAILDIQNASHVVASITRGANDGLAHHTYTFAPGGETIISGGSFGVIAVYDREGKTVGAFSGHEGKVFAAVPSPDGRYLVSAAADETVRLWNLKTRELLVSLFQGKDGEWVMWTPQGYFAASPAGAGLIGWQINHGPENAAEYVTAAQLRKSLNRPDIVVKAIQLASAEEAVRQSPGTKFKVGDLLAKPVPRFRIVSPAANATLTGGNAQLELALEETPDPVSAIRLYVNGSLVNPLPEEAPELKPGRLVYKVPLAKGPNLIRAVAVNSTGETPAEVAVDAQSEGALDKRGTLRILAIGVDKYPGLDMACRELDGITPKSCDLDAAASDATAFANAMAARLGPLHKSTVSALLVNGGKSGEPTAGKIVDALDELRGAEPNDTVLLFVSGHGYQEDQDYYFVPTDAEFARGRLRKSTAVLWAQFQSVLGGTNGRRFLFLDTCHSGNRYSQSITNEAYEQSIVVYAASRWDQEALESAGGGFFTRALVEGVNGKAKDKAGEVRAEGLRDYVRARVEQLAKPFGRDQEVQFVKGRDALDYVLALVN